MEEVEKIFEEHLTRQGFPIKHKKIEARFKSRFLGKGKGQDHTLVVEIHDLPPDETPTPEAQPSPSLPIFAEDD